MSTTATCDISASAQQATKTGPTILVVDDSPIDRRVVAAYLQNGLSARILTAANGLEALKILRREQPTLVLTDINMPDMNGLELIESIRENFPSLPVVIMTANGSEEFALQALQSGAASYVPKRELNNHLVSTVEGVLAAVHQERRKNRLLECITKLDCEYELENDPALVPHFVTHIQEQLMRMKLCDEHGKIRFGIAIEEALLNGLYHGNLELSSDLRQDGSNEFNVLAEQRRSMLPFSQRRLHVHVIANSNEAAFVVRDEGPGFDVSKLPDPTEPENLLKASGRGMLLIRTFMDEVKHNSTGNQLTMVKRRREVL